MLNKEREERKTRKDSLTEIPNVTEEKTAEGDKDDENSKLMMHLYDDHEMKIRQKEQMYGNMYLITELYIAKQLNGNIIKTCLDDL